MQKRTFTTQGPNGEIERNEFARCNYRYAVWIRPSESRWRGMVDAQIRSAVTESAICADLLRTDTDANTDPEYARKLRDKITAADRRANYWTDKRDAGYQNSTSWTVFGWTETESEANDVARAHEGFRETFISRAIECADPA